MQFYPYPDARLIIFARAPLSGQCKTRLIPVLGAQAAADLQQELIRHCIQRLCTEPLCPAQLWCSPDTRHPCFQTLATDYSLRLHTQQGKDLGARMYHAMSCQNASYTIIVGADIPTMTRDYIGQAIRLLRDGVDAVIGPAEDGGYVLLGLKRVPAGLFQDITWGTAAVFHQTCEKMDAAGLAWRAIAPLWDVDDAGDLQRYRELKITDSKCLE